ncbi:ankyrin repeat domain-containing protein [Rhodanobacter sp. AS-Z3]|uniref:ankyrin repeat domain-containing protein n=1 Tax=Rhodanobacter sp. AS-Z3 TaxID=3031330 RepID=UPI00247A0515|nr:ankyrin repeat domain-containing protein [Rhodanobacter sp. AS-Z3]WEN15253.1 ankyrin repeat domain-containing protein [Rhodanobacter sp. AS-Z3]
MTQPKSRRHPPFLQALAWFLPGSLAVFAAGLVTHPLTLIPLLLANALTLAAVCHAIGFDPEPQFMRTVLRRGAAHLVMFTGYTVLVFALVAWPMMQLTHTPSLSAALLLAAALVLALVALWRLWPAYGLLFLWDDAYPRQRDGSWIFTATLRSIAFARHLSREERFFSHFLPVAFSMLVLSFGAIALTGLYGVLPPEPRIAAIVLYGIVLLPLGCLVIANRTLRALLCESRHSRRRVDQTPSTAHRPTLTESERTAGTPDQAAALLAATRDGDIERALALLEVGAAPDTAPPAEDRDQRPVLMLAALLPDTRLLRALIAKGADVNHASGGLTPLLAATRDSWHGRAEAVLTLLANGASPLATDAEGNTALHGAVLSADAGVAAMLLDAAAPINALNQAGISPLANACRAANWPLVKFLLEHGAKPAPADGEPALVAASSIADDDIEGVKLLLKHRAAINALDARHRHALITAASEGHEQIARVLCAANADVNLVDMHGSSALMEAARAGAGGIVQLLAEAKADAGLRDDHGRDALTLACQSPRADADTVRALLALGAAPKVPGTDGRSALDHAAAAGRWDLVALLDPDTPLPASLSADVLTEGADTPGHLLEALRSGHWAVVSGFNSRVREWPQTDLARLYLDLSTPGLAAGRRWLLDHGLAAEARLEAPRTDDADTGEIAELPPLGQRLFDALLRRLPDTTEALDDLLQAGASPAGAGLLALALLHANGAAQAAALPMKMLEAGADPFGPDARGRTPLQLAANTAQSALLQALLERGCDPNARDRDGRTPLFSALEHGAKALPLVRALIAHGADPEAADANGETALGLSLEHPAVERWLDWRDWSRPNRALRANDLPAAARAGALTSVQRLLELGFAVDTRDEQGATALLHACGAGHRDIAACLLEASADPTLAARSGVTPLAAAVAARREALVALLLQHQVAVDQRLPNDATALMAAAAMGYPEIAEQLIDAGADIEAVDSAGRSALHAAAQFGFEHNDSLRARRLFDVLLKRGAEINHADNEGKTPLLLLLGAQLRPGSNCDATHIGALIPLLLDAGAQVAHADQRGVTALHACAMHALLPPARVLLSRGADRNATDAFGRTAAEVARQLGYVDIAHELTARSGTIPSVRQTLRQPAQPAD